MRILLTIGDISIVGGAERVVVNLANMFVEAGYEVEILSFFQAYATIPYKLHHNITLSILHKDSQEQFQKAKKGLHRIYYKNFYKCVLSWRLKRKYTGLDCIIVSDWIYTPFFKNKHTHYIKILHLNFTRYNKRNSYFDTLVLLSHRELDKYTPFHHCVCVIPNFLPTLPTQITDYTQKIVLSVGRMDKGDQKGFLRLIDIWEIVMQDSTFKDWRLHIVGDGVLKEEIQAKIESKGLQDCIILKPFTNHIDQEYLQSSVYAMSSRWEGFGMVLIESASYGLPAIAFDIATGPSDIILDSHTGFLVQDDDLLVYATKLQNLMRDESLRRDFGTQAKERVAQHFSKEAIMPLWQTLMQRG